MNLEDLLLAESLEQDGWSLSRPRYGTEGQLEVIGWSGKKCGDHKFYILRCSKCGQDSELFGEGYFKSLKSNLVRGLVPCGCSNIPKWSKGITQYD